MLMSDCQRGLRPVFTGFFFFFKYLSQLCKYPGKQVFKENSTFSVNFSATYFTDHIRFFLKSQRAKGKIKETHTEEYRS